MDGERSKRMIGYIVNELNGNIEEINKHLENLIKENGEKYAQMTYKDGKEGRELYEKLEELTSSRGVLNLLKTVISGALADALSDEDKTEEVRYTPKDGVESSIRYLQKEHGLTEREAQALVLDDIGFTLERIKKMMGVGEKAVANYIAAAKKKTEAPNYPPKSCWFCVYRKKRKCQTILGSKYQANTCIYYEEEK